jgi:High potential iron-sulfur protein
MGETCNRAGLSRRTVLITAAGAVPALALMPSAADAKLAQTAVKYQPDPKDGKQCNACNLFVEPNACKQVDGEIAPTGWCVLWVKKPG